LCWLENAVQSSPALVILSAVISNGKTHEIREMGILDIKRELRKLDKEKLIGLVADLYKKNKSVKEFFDFYVNPNERNLFEKYQDKVFESFYPKRGFEYKLKDGKQAITDFKKLATSVELVVDLMLFYVETGIKFTIDFGDINENFYLSLERTFVQALTLARKENCLEKFADRANTAVNETRDIGWGFHDYLAEVYFDFYPSSFDDIENDEQQPEKGKIIKLKRP